MTTWQRIQYEIIADMRRKISVLPLKIQSMIIGELDRYTHLVDTLDTPKEKGSSHHVVGNMILEFSKDIDVLTKGK